MPTSLHPFIFPSRPFVYCNSLTCLRTYVHWLVSSRVPVSEAAGRRALRGIDAGRGAAACQASREDEDCHATTHARRLESDAQAPSLISSWYTWNEEKKNMSRNRLTKTRTGGFFNLAPISFFSVRVFLVTRPSVMSGGFFLPQCLQKVLFHHPDHRAEG